MDRYKKPIAMRETFPRSNSLKPIVGREKLPLFKFSVEPDRVLSPVY